MKVLKIIAIQETTGILSIAAQQVNYITLPHYKNVQYLISMIYSKINKIKFQKIL